MNSSKIEQQSIFLGGKILPYESLGEVHFHYSAPILNNPFQDVVWTSVPLGSESLLRSSDEGDGRVPVLLLGGMQQTTATEDSCVKGEANHQVDGFLYVFVFPVFFSSSGGI